MRCQRSHPCTPSVCMALSCQEPLGWLGSLVRYLQSAFLSYSQSFEISDSDLSRRTVLVVQYQLASRRHLIS